MAKSAVKLRMAMFLTCGILSVAAVTRSGIALAADDKPASSKSELAGGGPTEEATNKDIPARSVVFELNKVDNSFGYDVEIKPFKQHWVNKYSFHIDNELLRVRLTPGHYQVHTRSYNKDRIAGRWSKWMSFWIQFKAPEASFPPEGAKIKPMGDRMEKITFEWKPVPLAKGYTFRLRDANGKSLKLMHITDTWFTTEVAVDSKFSWSVQPVVDARLQDPNQKYPFNHFEVLKPGEGMRTMSFEIGSKKDAVMYQFEFVRVEDNGETSPPARYDSRESNFKVRLTPGRYEVRVRSQDKSGSYSDWSPPSKFFITFFPPKPLGPIKGEHVEADDDDAASVTLKWQPVFDVHHYKVYVFDSSGKLLVTKAVDTNKVQIQLPHNQSYKWKVVAYSLDEPDRRPASADDKDVSNFTLDKFIKVDLNAAEESSAWYGWLRTVSSQISYTGMNYDNNSLITQKVLANAAELAGGVWIRKTDFGFLLNGTLSGYRTSAQTFTYDSFGLNVGYRRIYDEASRLRVWGGYYFRQIPELLANPYSTDYQINRIIDSGPQLQVSYHHALNGKWGWHTYGILYYGIKDQGTPTGLSSVPEFSYTLGLAATYKFSDYYTGMIGYAYKDDRASYNSSDRTGNPNSVDYSGHYLNLILEFGLSKPHNH